MSYPNLNLSTLPLKFHPIVDVSFTLISDPTAYPSPPETFHNLQVGHAYYAGEAHRAERNARVGALLNFYGLVDDKVCWTPNAPPM